MFDKLRELIAESSVMGLDAEQLAMAVEETAARSGDQEALNVLTVSLPVLKALRPLLASPSRARQACAMVHFILQSRARIRKSQLLAVPRPTPGEEANHANGTLGFTPVEAKRG